MTARKRGCWQVRVLWQGLLQIQLRRQMRIRWQGQGLLQGPLQGQMRIRWQGRVLLLGLLQGRVLLLGAGLLHRNHGGIDVNC